MKKTFSMLLAVIMAAIAVCTFSVVGFAADENDDPVDAFVTAAATEAPTAAPTEAATQAPTAAATQAPATTAAPASEAATEATTAAAPLFTLPEIPSNLADILATAPIETLAPGQTAIDDGDTTAAATNAPATTRRPANVDNTIPGTGSSVIVPAIALLALAAGTVAVVKTKKED